MDRSSVIDLIRLLEKIDEDLGGSGSRKIEVALVEALTAEASKKIRLANKKRI